MQYVHKVMASPRNKSQQSESKEEALTENNGDIHMNSRIAIASLLLLLSRNQKLSVSSSSVSCAYLGASRSLFLAFVFFFFSFQSVRETVYKELASRNQSTDASERGPSYCVLTYLNDS